ncbi:uncharacterized protein LOC124358371 [Homalodisca vitripennis]|uniref:uncharacterized protein LOC124358371 n=1 Tax=Homalodisca vitripennis TaxID=197043 RepID=UPI001EEB2C43|nr:uncharacterized protein LOC124358371 [Homalodisca vitripennis]
MMGDFNAKIGNDNTDRESVMGKHGMGTMNDNGERLADLCLNQSLVIGGSVFPHKDCHKVTWLSPDRKTENQIDHICIDKSWRKSLLDVRNKRGADAGTDHHLIIGVTQLKISSTAVKLQCAQRKWDLVKLKDETKKVQFSMQLKNRFQALRVDDIDDEAPHERENPSEKIEKKWKNFKEIFQDTAEEVLGYGNKNRPDWISEETWEAIQNRKQAKHILNQCRTRDKKEAASREYSRANRNVKRLFRRDKRKYINYLADKAQEAADRGDSKTLYVITKRLSRRKAFADSKPIKSKTGDLLVTEEAQLKRWRQHFQEVLNRTVNQNDEEDREQDANVAMVMNEQVGIEVNAPGEREIAEAIRKLKNCKAPGEDNIPGEFLKLNADEAALFIHPLITDIWENEYVPKDWNTGLLVKIPKKGNLADCDNWRGITLTSVPSKILCRIILNRIRESVDDKLRREQSGFRAGKSCADQINTLRSKEEELQTLGAEIKILKSRLDLEKDILQEEMDTSFKVQDQSTSEILSLNKRIESLQAALRQRDLHFAGRAGYNGGHGKREILHDLADLLFTT